jgi:site-specific DNA-adenine methylase
VQAIRFAVRGNEEGGEIMSRVIDVSGQKIEIIQNFVNGDDKAFVYLDPPYYPVAKTKDGKISPYRLYNGTDYTPLDFLKLKMRCDELTQAGMPFVLSNSDSEFIRLLFKDYCLVEIDETRVMKQGKGKGSRRADRCLIITNFKRKDEFMEAIKGFNNIQEAAA